MIDEKYKPIPGWDGYYASADGHVYSAALGRELRAGARQKRSMACVYVTVPLKRDGKPHVMRLHRVIAETFCPKKKGQDIVHHINGDQRDNRAENLVWMTAKEHREEHKKIREIAKGG